MARRSLELILARSFAGNLAVPCFVSDANGTIVWFNEPAERLIGRTAEETPELSPADFASILDARDEDGGSTSPKTLPFVRALHDRAPALLVLGVTGADGSDWLHVCALPLLAPDGETLGAFVACYPGTGKP